MADEETSRGIQSPQGSGCPFTRQAVLGLAAAGLAFLIPQALRPTAAFAASGDMCGMSSGPTPTANMHDMETVMTLFRNHDHIRREVLEVPGGIRATTESDEPRIAGLIQAHVAAMYGRVETDRPFIMMSRTLPTLFRDAKGYQRRLRITPKGVSITETSSDPQLVEVIRAHGREVTGFVDDGMASMMDGMMGTDMMMKMH